MTTEGHLDRAAVERVIRRAAQLAPVRHDLDAAMPESAVVAAAGEVGIPAEHMHRAIAYERLGPAPSNRRTDALVGPAIVVVEREVPGDRESSMAALDSWLVTAHHLRRDRQFGDGAQWRRRDDPAAVVERSMRSLTGDGRLGKARVIAAQTADLPGGRSIVRLAVHRRAARSASLAVGGAIAGVGVAGATVAAALVAPIVAVGAPVAVVVGAVVVRSGHRAAQRDRHELECLADALERGEQPRLLRDELKHRIRRPR